MYRTRDRTPTEVPGRPYRRSRVCTDVLNRLADDSEVQCAQATAGDREGLWLCAGSRCVQ